MGWAKTVDRAGDSWGTPRAHCVRQSTAGRKVYWSSLAQTWIIGPGRIRSIGCTERTTYVRHYYALEVFSSALEIFLNDMRYINSRFTYLLTTWMLPILMILCMYSGTCLGQKNSGISAMAVIAETTIITIILSMFLLSSLSSSLSVSLSSLLSSPFDVMRHRSLHVL